MTFRRRYNEMAQKVPVLGAVKRTVLRPIDRAIHRNELAIVNGLKAFVPNSAADHKSLAHLTLQAADQSFPFLLDVLEVAHGVARAHPVDVTRFAETPERTRAAEDLKRHLDAHGSDKAARHNYHHIYGPVLAGLAPGSAILEVGLGTNNTDVASNMGPGGRPGASLRAFSEFRPDIDVFGADIDRRILFSEGRIKTFFVDQTAPPTFEDLGRSIGRPLDLVIDDGLHSPNANLATMAFALRNLKPGGWFVIEDISANALPIWQAVKAAMPDRFNAQIVSSAAALMFVAVNNSAGSE